MDIPGVHVDGSVLLALFTLVNTALLIWQARTVQATHQAVNGMQAVKVEAAYQAGVAVPTLVPPGGPPA